MHRSGGVWCRCQPQYQSSHPERGDYTESYQCIYHEHMARMIAARPWPWATYAWNMFDLAAAGRDDGGKHGENQKGLVTFDRKLKRPLLSLQGLLEQESRSCTCAAAAMWTAPRM